jgi:hypothetical protein
MARCIFSMVVAFKTSLPSNRATVAGENFDPPSEIAHSKA